MINFHSLDNLIRHHLSFHVSSTSIFRQQQNSRQSQHQQEDEHQPQDAFIHASLRTIRSLILSGNIDEALTLCSKLTPSSTASTISIDDPKSQLQIRIQKLVELLHTAENQQTQSNINVNTITAFYKPPLEYAQQLAHYALNAFPEAYVTFTKCMMLFLAPERLSSSSYINRRRRALAARVVSVIRLVLGARLSAFEFMLRYLLLLYFSRALFEDDTASSASASGVGTASNESEGGFDKLHETVEDDRESVTDVLLQLLRCDGSAGDDEVDEVDADEDMEEETDKKEEEENNGAEGEGDNVKDDEEVGEEGEERRRRRRGRRIEEKRRRKRRKRRKKLEWKTDGPVVHRLGVQQVPIEADVQALPERLGISRQQAVNALKLTDGNVEAALKNELARAVMASQRVMRLVVDYCAARGLPLFKIQEEEDDNVAEKEKDKGEDKMQVDDYDDIIVDDIMDDDDDDVERNNSGGSGGSSNINDYEFEEDDEYFAKIDENDRVVVVKSNDISDSSREMGLVMRDVRKALQENDEKESFLHLRQAAKRARRDCDNDNISVVDASVADVEISTEEHDEDSKKNSKKKNRNDDGVDEVNRELQFRLAQREVLLAFNEGDFSKALGVVVTHLAPVASVNDELQAQLRLTLTMLACSPTNNIGISCSGMMTLSPELEKEKDVIEEINRGKSLDLMNDDDDNYHENKNCTDEELKNKETYNDKKEDVKGKDKEENKENENEDVKQFDDMVSNAKHEVSKFCSPNAIADGIYKALIFKWGQPELVRVLMTLIRGHEEWLKKSQMKDRFSSAFSIDDLCSPDIDDVDHYAHSHSPAMTLNGDSNKSSNSANHRSDGGGEGERGHDGVSLSTSGGRQCGSGAGTGHGEADARMEETIITLMEFLAMSRADALAVVRNHPRAANAEAILNSLLGTS